jgi:hypothetical protein
MKLPTVALSSTQLDIVLRAAKPLHPSQRGAFLQRFAMNLCGRVTGNTTVLRAVADAQAQLRRGTIDHEHE